METFKDKKGRTWKIKIDAGMLKHVEDVHGFKMRHMFAEGGKLFLELRDDVITFVEVLSVLVDCEGAGVEERDFGEAMAGDEISDAWEAFDQEVRNFYPRHQQKPVRDLMEAQEEMMAKAVTTVSTSSIPEMIFGELASKQQESQESKVGAS